MPTTRDFPGIAPTSDFEMAITLALFQIVRAYQSPRALNKTRQRSCTAIQAVKKDGMTVTKASKRFRIPYGTQRMTIQKQEECPAKRQLKDQLRLYAIRTETCASP